MGDYSVSCAVSGIPFRHGQKVVGFNLEPMRFPGGKGTHIPASWPVFGEYDMCGGIEDENLDCECAIIHRAIWDNAHIYWHRENRPYISNWLDVEQAREKAKKEFESDKRIDFNPTWGATDYFFYALKEQFHQTDFGLVFRNLIDGKKSAGSGGEKNQSFLFRSNFMEEILTKMLERQWTNKEQTVLDKIVCLYSGQMMFGRAIAPSNSIYVEQYPEYKQRIDILKMNLVLAKKLAADLKKD